MASFIDNLRDFFNGIGQGINDMWNAPVNNNQQQEQQQQPTQQVSSQPQFGDPLGGGNISAAGQKQQTNQEEEFKETENKPAENDFLKNLYDALGSIFNNGNSQSEQSQPEEKKENEAAKTLERNDLVAANLGRTNEKAQTFVDQNGFLRFGNPFLQQNNSNDKPQENPQPQTQQNNNTNITEEAVKFNDQGSNGLSGNNVTDLGFVNLHGNSEQKEQQQEQPQQQESKADDEYVEYTYKPGDTFGQVILDLGLNTKKGLWGTDGDVAHYTQQLIDQGLWKNNNNKNGNIPIGTKIRLKKRKV